MRYLLFAMIVFFTGCELDEKKAVLMQQKEKSSSVKQVQKEDNKSLQAIQMQNEAAIALEQIRAQNAKELQQMELEAKQKELEVTKELKKQENEIALSTHQDNLQLYKIALIVVGILTLFIALIIYLIAKKNRETKIKMQEEQLRSEYNLKQQEFYNQRVNKLLEIAASKDSDEKVKKDAIEMIKNDHNLKRLDFKDD